jgi:CDP-diacylglycerol--glycerol-3-phosphate 3-phosphatidyltransferase
VADVREAQGTAAPREVGVGSRPAARIGSPANLLGIARILATPVIIGLVLLGQPGFGVAAAVLYVVAALTDFADGWLARSRGEVSPLGVFMDLTADKVLVAGTLIVLVEVDLLPTWIVATILVRELVVAGVRQVAAAEEVVISARALGKAKTMATNVGIALLLLAHDAATGGPLASTDAGAALLAIGFWTMLVATVLTIASGWQYLSAAFPLLRGQRD